MKSIVFTVLFLVHCLSGFASAQGADTATQRIMSVQQAQIADLKALVKAQAVELSDLKTSVKTLSDTQKTQGTAIVSSQKSADDAKTLANAAQTTASASLPVKGFWNQSGLYSSCNAQCASQGMRCLTGQANPVASSFAVGCNVGTNVCICTIF